MWMAGSSPMLIEIGSGRPAASAFWRNTSMCLRVRKMESSSRPCTQRRWMVTSCGAFGVGAEDQPEAEVRSGVLFGVGRAGSKVRRSKAGSSARWTTSCAGRVVAHRDRLDRVLDCDAKPPGQVR